MLTRAARLGDDIDDFCVKCKRVMNHAVVSLVQDQPAKVRCRTCHSDHDYRHEQAPPPKVDARKAALFNQVLENATGKPASADPEAEAEAEAAATGDALSDSTSESTGESTSAEQAAEKPKARKKARA
jgi:hypothetical protein